jgi:hypothetical protein
MPDDLGYLEELIFARIAENLDKYEHTDTDNMEQLKKIAPVIPIM